MRGMGDGPTGAQVCSDERGFGMLHFGGPALNASPLWVSMQ
ncbi:hypothetical protein HDE77_001003 [Rhodanobacter sp. MP7CTX1]|nr:hypothetical protein [Rhodanobacter sp. MP7CTX1]